MPTTDGWVERQINLLNKHHLHMRPAQRIVETATQFASDVRAVKDELDMDAKSILDMIEFANYMVSTTDQADSVFTFRAQGDDAEAALTALDTLVKDHFGLD